MHRVVIGMGAGLLLLGAAGCGTAAPSSNGSPPTSGGNGGSPTLLQPAALDEGQCEDGPTPNGGLFAQVAVSGTPCSIARTVAEASGNAGGSAYSSNGFACAAIQRGTGSEWAQAWEGTYYSYTCVDGTFQVAFNWGPASEYVD